VPRELTVDNGKQFDCQDFREYYHRIRIKLRFASVYHPQSNGAVERANDQIFSAIKKCLFDQKKGKWADELFEGQKGLSEKHLGWGFRPKEKEERRFNGKIAIHLERSIHCHNQC
jgi:transposase InsO family protein